MIKFIKKLIKIVNEYDINIESIQKRYNSLNIKVNEAIKVIKYRTEINADIRLHGPNRNQIIVVGRYRNKDYIEVYTITDKDVNYIVDQLKEMQKYGVVNKIDSVPMLKKAISRNFDPF